MRGVMETEIDFLSMYSPAGMSGRILGAERVLECIERVPCVPDKCTKHALERVERVLCILECVERVPEE